VDGDLRSVIGDQRAVPPVPGSWRLPKHGGDRVAPVASDH
jgi:hypothetical protein